MKRVVVAAVLLLALAFPAGAAAALPSWNLTGVYTVNFICTSSECVSTYVHSMTIATSDDITGAVAGTGFVVGYPGSDYAVTGTVSGSDVTLDIEFSSPDLQIYNPLLLTGVIDPSGGMSGTAGDGAGRTFTWATTAGAAAPIATQLAFTAYPSNPSTTDLGTITVALEDAGGSTVTSDTRTVSLSINQGAGTFTCSGGLSKPAVSGVATFTGCTQSTIADGYAITASATGLSDLIGATFDVTAVPAMHIHLWWMCNVPPGSSCPPMTWGVGIPFSWQPAVEVEDAQGNTVTSDNTTSTTLEITPGTPTTGGPGTLTCTNGLTMTVTAGWAYFSGCSIDTVGTGYGLTAATTSLGSYTRSPFDVTGPGTSAQLVFTASPPATTYASLGTVEVAVEDAFGTVVGTDTSSIGLQLWYDNGHQQATLYCTGGTTQSAVNGVATYTGCTAPGPGSGYFLEAYPVGGNFFGDSSLFTVIAPPSGGGRGTAPAVPQITLAVSANPTTLTASGSVTYTYSVTNPGSVTLSGVTVSDATCSPATYVAGDTNKDNLLQPGETWTYTCTTTLSATTTDAAKASGTGNGSTVSATAATTVTVTAAPALMAVTLTDGIATGVNRGTSGFGTRSLVVAPNTYITVLARTDPNLAGSLVEIWVKSTTSDWHPLTLRRVATDGTVHYFARVNGWTAYWVKFPGDTTHAPASSHGRIATNGS